ncbi:MAG: hypothetical protein ABR511_04995 [Acidimicrobiales bacterium]
MTRTSRITGLLLLAAVMAAVATVLTNGHPSDILLRLDGLYHHYLAR